MSNVSDQKHVDLEAISKVSAQKRVDHDAIGKVSTKNIFISKKQETL